MFKKLSFGQYSDKQTLIHQLDPRIKIISVIALSMAVFLISSYYKMLIFSLFILFLVYIAKISFASLIRNIRPLFSIFIFIFLMYLLFSRNELYKGIFTIWKFTLFVVIASLLTFTTTITNMVTAIEKLLTPLKIFNIQPRIAALLISLTIRFIPLLFLYADRIKDARLARLYSLKRPKHIKLLFAPLIDRLFKSASTLSDAITARSYTAERKYYFNTIELGSKDIISLALLLITLFFVLK